MLRNTQTAFLAASLAACVGLASSAAAGSQPNILLIISDDAGWADFGFNDQGNGQIPTPAIDSIADSGRWFRAAYTAPVCSPSRARIFLGQHGQRVGYDNNNPDDMSAANPIVEGIRVEDVTMFERLKTAGYATGYFGKWHLGTELDEVVGGQLVTPGNLPPRHGIDYFLGLTSGSRTYFTGRATGYSKVLREQTINPSTGLINDVDRESAYPADTYMTDLLAEEAADYISAEAAQPGPFFTVLSFTAPHGPLEATQADFDFVDQNIPGLTGNRRTYAAMMVAMDRGVQTVLDRLDDPNEDGSTADSVRGDTLICFINDNGGETANSARNFPLRGKKSDTYDGGIRVVMAMSGPGIPATGASFDNPVDSADLVPTFLAAAGSPLGPSDATDGVNLLPYLDGTLTGPPRERVFVRGNNPLVAGVREGAYKLTIENAGGPFLYDIVANPGENVVRNSEFPEVTDALTDVIHEFEADYVKPRWGGTDYNGFDGFVYRASAVGTSSWGQSGVWSAESGSPAPATMFSRDGYANLRMSFPVRATPYAAANTLTRPNLLPLMANAISFTGTYGGPADSRVTLDGLPVMMTSALDGAPARVTMDTTATAAGAHPAELALDLIAWDDVTLDGSGDQPIIVSGDLLEERPGRSYSKAGAFPLRLQGTVDISGNFDVEDGELTVTEGGHAAPAVLGVGADAVLTLAGGAQPATPDLIGNQTELAIVSPAGPASIRLDFDGTEVVGMVSLDGAPLAGDFFDAASHPALFAGTGRLRIRGPLDCDGDVNNDGYAEFFDTLQYLRTFDANEGCGGGGPALPGGITVNNEAWADTPGDSTWQLAPPGTDASRVWTFGGVQSPETVTDGPSPLISAAYSFPGAAASGADYEDPSRSPSSIELWFKATSTAAEQILWEAGGGARGAAFTIANGEIRFDVQNGSPAPVRVTAPITTGWHQAIGVVDISTGDLRLYIDGVRRDDANTGSTDRWAGGNPSGLGQVSSSMVGSLTPAPFDGRIAAYRFYNNTALSDAAVATAYDAVISASSPCPSEADLDGNGVLEAADIELHLLQFDACE